MRNLIFMVKKVFSIPSIFIFAGLAIFLFSGCGQPVNDGILEQDTTRPLRPDLPLLDKQSHGTVETAYFALGWFWGSDSQFGSIEGVIRTRVGYCGGTTANPNYYNIGNYSETVQVDYDPTLVSYKQLLSAFWDSHDATYPSYSTQYRSAIFYTTDQQNKLAREALKAEEDKIGKKIFTDIEQFSGFYIAEDYHQKYTLRQTPAIVNDLYTIYPDSADFRDSTAAARLNGYVAGYGDSNTLKKDLNNLGLSESGKTALLQRTQYGIFPVCPVAGSWSHRWGNSNF